MNERQMEHLGDGVCVDFDGNAVRLFTPRENGIHEVYLEQPAVLAFLAYVTRIGLWQPMPTINEPVEHKDDSQ